MNKILLAVFCSVVILGSPLVASAVKITRDVEREVVNNYLDAEQYENFTGYQFTSYGPKSPLYTHFSIDEGRLLNPKLLWPSFVMTVTVRLMLLRYPLMRPNSILVSDIDFTLTYKRNITGPPSKNIYFTIFGYYENGTLVGENTTIYNTKHTVKVKGFTGVIVLTKRCVYAGSPKIVIIGVAENVSLVSIDE